MLTIWQAIIFGALQGITELFPISSLGHSVILPKLLGWNIHQEDPYFLSFLVATHLATATVLFFYFFADWKQIIAGFFRSVVARKIKSGDSFAKLAWLIIIGTLPAGFLGLVFEHKLRTLFASPEIVAFVLILNGLLLYGAERLRRKRSEEKQEKSDERIAQKLNFVSASKIGFMQALALLPGFSRTGSAITGGLLSDLPHIDAARFSFLLATPIIGAAAVLKLPRLFTAESSSTFVSTIAGALFAALFAYLSVRFLTKYFETDTLAPFAIYCVTLGIISSLIFLVK